MSTIFTIGVRGVVEEFGVKHAEPRMTFHGDEELPKMRKWFKQNRNPSEAAFRKFASVLNRTPIRLRRAQVTVKKLRTWWRNEKLRSKNPRGRRGKPAESSSESSCEEEPVGEEMETETVEFVPVVDVPAEHVIVQNVSSNLVTVQEVPSHASEQVTIQNVPSEYVTVQNVPSELVTVENVQSEHVTIENVPSEHVTIQNVPSEHVTVQNVPSEHVTVQNVPSEHVTVQNVPSEHVTVTTLPNTFHQNEQPDGVLHGGLQHTLESLQRVQQEAIEQCTEATEPQDDNVLYVDDSEDDKDLVSEAISRSGLSLGPALSTLPPGLVSGSGGLHATLQSLRQVQQSATNTINQERAMSPVLSVVDAGSSRAPIRISNSPDIVPSCGNYTMRSGCGISGGTSSMNGSLQQTLHSLQRVRESVSNMIRDESHQPGHRSASATRADENGNKLPLARFHTLDVSAIADTCSSTQPQVNNSCDDISFNSSPDLLMHQPDRPAAISTETKAMMTEVTPASVKPGSLTPPMTEDPMMASVNPHSIIGSVIAGTISPQVNPKAKPVWIMDSVKPEKLSASPEAISAQTVNPHTMSASVKAETISPRVNYTETKTASMQPMWRRDSAEPEKLSASPGSVSPETTTAFTNAKAVHSLVKPRPVPAIPAVVNPEAMPTSLNPFVLLNRHETDPYLTK